MDIKTKSKQFLSPKQQLFSGLRTRKESKNMLPPMPPPAENSKQNVDQMLNMLEQTFDRVQQKSSNHIASTQDTTH